MQAQHDMITNDNHFAVTDAGAYRTYSCTGICSINVPVGHAAYCCVDGKTTALAVHAAYKACGKCLASEILRSASRASLHDSVDFEGAFFALEAALGGF